MKHPRIWLSLAGIALAWFATAARADVNVLYTDPLDGWSYSYLGEGDSYDGDPFDSPEDVPFGQLDGTWDSYNGCEQWDHYTGGGAYDYRIGTVVEPNFLGIGSPPGGVLAVDDSNGDGTKYLRVQDPGDPSQLQYGWEHTSTSQTNKKLNFVHDISNTGTANTEILDVGVTLSFRARIATAAADPDAPLDPAYPEAGDGPLAWPAEGDGGVVQMKGNGMFGICQYEPFHSFTEASSQVGFSLALSSDLEKAGAGGLGSGLVMNNLVTDDIPSASGVDTDGSSTNIVPIPDEDLIEWREFWITIQANDSTPGNGTHTVAIYLDGSVTPQTFNVTASYMNSPSMFDQYVGFSYLQMAASDTSSSSAVDIDFFSYKEGVHVPTSAGLPGDFDVDGDVDGNDFLIWQRGELPNPLSPSDLATWQAHFGNPGASAVSVAVPEPATAVMTVLWMIALGVARVRRSRLDRRWI